MSENIPLLAIHAGSVSFGGSPLFKDINFSLSRGQKYCLIGRNGSGKSTLLKILAQKIDLDTGRFFFQPGTKVAYLSQEVSFPLEGTIQDLLSQDLPAEESYQIDKISDLLGFSPFQSLHSLSGGEKRRVALAQVLLQNPDVLLLDEPTNHLDLPSILLLEQWIQNFRGALVVISHDRQFLRRISTSMAFLDRGQLYLHTKGYDFYEEWMETLAAAEEAYLARLNKTLEAETHWLHRGVTARRKRNQGRLRRLMALRQDRAHHIPSPGKIQLPPLSPDAGSRLILETHNLGKSYEQEGQEQWVFRHFTTRILRGDRIGIIGANGSGKTTLIRVLTGDLTPDEGEVRQGTTLEAVYFDQHRKTLDPHKSLWETLCPQGGDHVVVQGKPKHVVSYLKDFLFSEKQVKALVKTLSGGEANRLRLAQLLAIPSQLMILDEPTNDLDMDTLDLLEEVLSEYTGTLLIVSHDRDFLDRIVTSTIFMEPQGQPQEYAGGFTDALAQSGKKISWEKKKGISKEKTAPSGASTPTSSTPRRPRLTYIQQRRLSQLPTEMEKLSQEIEALESLLADPQLYGKHPSLFTEKSKELEEKKALLDRAEEEWLQLASLEESFLSS